MNAVASNPTIAPTATAAGAATVEESGRHKAGWAETGTTAGAAVDIDKVSAL
jgi:hypothetical protein